MTVARIMMQFEQHRRLHPFGTVPLETQLQGQAVRLGKGRAEILVAEDVRVGVQHAHGVVPVTAVHSDADTQADIVSGKELQQSPESGLLPESRADLLRPLSRDALDLRQPFGALLHDPQGVLPEGFHDVPGCGRTDAFDDTGRKVLYDPCQGGWQEPLHMIRSELGPVDLVGHPLALCRELLSRGGIGQRAHHGNDPAFLQGQAENRIAVFFIGIDDGLNASGNDRLLSGPALRPGFAPDAAHASTGRRYCPV